jgi:redox-sensitive bicupin YhaK (pirin superfamily)
MIDLIIDARTRDLGGFTVGRVLPSPKRRLVGPFIFFDQMGPAVFAPGQGMDVRPHPHIGLATVTYLFEGAIRHKDSLGFEQDIQPGDVNWMTAGRGIVHSERTPPALRETGFAIHGIQSWIALPQSEEQRAPCFKHHPASSLPSVTIDNARRTLIAGSAFHAVSPVDVFSPMFYMDVEAEPGASVYMPQEHEERALYVASGSVLLGGERYEAGKMLVLSAGATVQFTTDTKARVMLLGGAPMEGPRHIFWNFVATSDALIEEAKADWSRYGAPGHRFATVPGETEHIPLPTA